jgi:putative serine protease PepD
MVKPTPRPGNRVAAFIGLAAAIAIVAGACSSAVSKSAYLPASGNAGATSPTSSVQVVPAALSTATAAPSAPISAAAGALDLQNQLVSVIKQVTPSVVEIDTASALGSGVIYDNRGDIVTNAHVVGTDTTFTVTLSDGRSFPATLVGKYAPDDIAVIHINATGLTASTWGNSSDLSVGDFVLAMGNPLGLQSSVTEGIVSALGRQVSEPTGNALPDAIQTSAAINPGNSGGALVDLQGRVVGIPTLTATNTQVGGTAAGIGFAISSNRARFIADQLIATGKVTHSGRAYMGVELRDTVGGATIMVIAAGGPAARAGLVVGDVVVSVNGKATADAETLIDTTASHHPGEVVKVVVRHAGGTTSTISLTLGELPS